MLGKFFTSLAGRIDGDSDDQRYQLFADDDIVQHEIQQEEVNDENDEEDESEENHNIPSCGDVKDMLDKCLL